MRFSEALEQCMAGKKIRNMAWNGNVGTYVYWVKPHTIPAEKWVPGDLSELEKEQGVRVLGHFDMKMANGNRLIGWLASQADMQSDQWVVVED